MGLGLLGELAECVFDVICDLGGVHLVDEVLAVAVELGWEYFWLLEVGEAGVGLDEVAEGLVPFLG